MATFLQSAHLLLGNKKDISKYWYVEKYVYGKLVETLEIPLKTSTYFTAVASEYSDDTFYGWSVSPTSTTLTFNSTAKYSDTSTYVNNNLDSENTLKIYAIYKYTKTSIQYTTKTLCSGSNLTSGIYSGSATTLADGTCVLKGLICWNMGSRTSYGALCFNRSYSYNPAYEINRSASYKSGVINQTSTYYSSPTDQNIIGNYVSLNLKAGDTVYVSFCNQDGFSSSGSWSISLDGYFETTSIFYRVISHS